MKGIIESGDLLDNPQARIAVCLCLDVSGSMSGQAIEELNHGVEAFFSSILSDEMAMYSAEVCIVTFGANIDVKRSFSTLDESEEPPIIEAEGNTPLGEALIKSLDLLDERKEEYKRVGVDYYQPWLVVMTDGTPNGDPEILEKAVSRIGNLVNMNKLSVFPIAIGQYADMNVLNRISPKRQALRLQGFKFNEFFLWLSKSVSKTSQSIPGEYVELDFEAIKGWGML